MGSGTPLQTKTKTKKKFIQLIKHRDVKLVPTWSLHPYEGEGRYSVGYQKRNINTNPTIEPLTYNLSCLQDIAINGAIELVGITNQCLIWLAGFLLCVYVYVPWVLMYECSCVWASECVDVWGDGELRPEADIKLFSLIVPHFILRQDLSLEPRTGWFGKSS